MSEAPVKFDPKNMLYRRLGSSGLRVPVFSIGGCKFCARIITRELNHASTGLTIGKTVNGDKVKVSTTHVVVKDLPVI
jgi:hypothetical protein